MSDDSRRAYNVAGLLLILAGVAIQVWAIILQTHPSVNVSNLTTIGMLPVFPGSILLVEAHLERLFAIHARINYAISLIGLAGMVLLWFFYGPLTDLVYPRTGVVATLIVHSFWILMLGALTGHFHTKWLEERHDASTGSD